MKGKRKERRKEGGRRKGAERKGRIPLSKKTWRLDSSGQKQQPIFEGLKADERVQVLTEGTPVKSKPTHTAEPQEGSGTAYQALQKARVNAWGLSENMRALRSPAKFLPPERKLSNRGLKMAADPAMLRAPVRPKRPW